MEDSSLDDFFAKKDKTKKKSTKGSKLTPSDILKQVEKPKKSSKKKDKENPKQSSSRVSGKEIEEDDEWKDYQEEEQKDFSDLKIQNLQITSTDDKEDTERLERSGSEDEDGEGREKKDASGPWNKASASQSVTVVDSPVVVEKQEAPKPEPPKSTGKYIPPGARRAMESGSVTSPSGPAYSRRKKAAPDVMSELDFPTLGGGPAGNDMNYESVSGSNSGKFEQVRSGGRQTEDPRSQANQLELGNKYDALAGAD